MNKLIISIAVFLITMGANAQSGSPEFKLQVKVSNLASNEGILMLEMLTDSNTVYKELKIPVSSYECELVITNVPKGNYGIRYYHDENGNGKMDSYFMGIPKEGYGFSNNPYSRFGSPELSKTLFAIQANRAIAIETVNW